MTQSAVARFEAGGICPLSALWNLTLTPWTPTWSERCIRGLVRKDNSQLA